MARDRINSTNWLTGWPVSMSDVPIGEGLSSSAAIECAIMFALNELYCKWISTEHEYAGVMCGIMDQFAVRKLPAQNSGYRPSHFEVLFYFFFSEILLANTLRNSAIILAVK